jgi:putative transposase
MPRAPRVFVDGLSLHVIQRGNNRTDVFRQEADYHVFLALLQKYLQRRSVNLHAYVLMTNHFHLLLTPKNAEALPTLMRDLDSAYVLYFNRRHQRIGTLWNGRYRGIHIEDERYWLTCLRYIELNPVRAGMTRSPAAYRWSSHTAHADGHWPEWLTPHPLYEQLGDSPEARQNAYREICALPLPQDHVQLLR